MRRKINQLVKLTKKTLRMFCMFIFFHWIFFTDYASCTNYYESINKAEDHKEEVEYGSSNKQTIANIEESILKEVESKSNKSGLKREWAKHWFPQLEAMPNSSQEEKEEYHKKLEEGKKKTIKNIQEQLKKNGLDITELDDQRTPWEKIKYDPLKFFFLSPLNKINKFLRKSLNSQEPFLLEIIFKLLVVKLFFFFFVSYSEKETRAFSEGLKKVQDPSLSVEEKEKIQQEISPLVWRGIFNFLMTIFVFFFSLHPCFVDRISSQFLVTSSWFKWALPMIGVSFLSSIGNEFLRQGRILKFREIKDYLFQNWLVITIMGLVFNVALPYFLPTIRNTYGFQLIIFCGGLIDFMINIIRVGISNDDPNPMS